MQFFFPEKEKKFRSVCWIAWIMSRDGTPWREKGKNNSETFLFLFEFFWIDCNTFEPCMERVVETLIVNFSLIPIHIWLNQSDDENWDILERRFPAFPFDPQYNDSSSCWAFWFFFHIISYISVKRVKLCHHVNPMWESFFLTSEKEGERAALADEITFRNSLWFYDYFCIYPTILYHLHFINGIAS